MINPIKPKPWIIRSPWVPVLLVTGIATTIALNALGVISLPHISLSNFNIVETSNQGIYPVTSAATVGKYFEYDFSKELINDLEPQGRETPGIYSFYLGSGVGFPPLGLKLDLNGVLKGIPAGTGDSKFEVCVKDVGGKSACRTYVMGVDPKAITTAKPSKILTPASTPTSNINVAQGIGFPGIWEGTMTEVEHGNLQWPPGCNWDMFYRFNFTQNANELRGTMTVIYFTRVAAACQSSDGFKVMSALVGKTGTGPITGTINGTSVTFSSGSSEIRDYTVTLVGNELNVKMITCHSPDPRCTTSSVDESIGGGVIVSTVTDNWWTGEFTAVRTN